MNFYQKNKLAVNNLMKINLLTILAEKIIFALPMLKVSDSD